MRSVSVTSTGTDTVTYLYGVNGTAGVTVSLAAATGQSTGGSGTDTLSGIENLTGSNNADTLTGSARSRAPGHGPATQIPVSISKIAPCAEHMMRFPSLVRNASGFQFSARPACGQTFT